MQTVIQKTSNKPTQKAFSGLMDLYEQNYIKLRNLMPEQALLGDNAISVVQGCLDLHYELLESCKYTSIFRLTYHFNEKNRGRAEPNLEIRLYHDARVAEVMSGTLHCDYYQCIDSKYGVGMLSGDQNLLARKWKLNRFLYKWLNFCLAQGHKFQPANSTDISKLLADIQTP